jgi:hypothetical protein
MPGADADLDNSLSRLNASAMELADFTQQFLHER